MAGVRLLRGGAGRVVSMPTLYVSLARKGGGKCLSEVVFHVLVLLFLIVLVLVPVLYPFHELSVG